MREDEGIRKGVKRGEEWKHGRMEGALIEMAVGKKVEEMQNWD